MCMCVYICIYTCIYVYTLRPEDRGGLPDDLPEGHPARVGGPLQYIYIYIYYIYIYICIMYVCVYSTDQHGTVQYSIVSYSIVSYRPATVQYGAVV